MVTGSKVEGAKTRLVFLDDGLSLVFPEIERLFGAPCRCRVLQEQGSREIGEALTHALTTLGIEPTVCPHHWWATSWGATAFQ